MAIAPTLTSAFPSPEKGNNSELNYILFNINTHINFLPTFHTGISLLSTYIYLSKTQFIYQLLVMNISHCGSVVMKPTSIHEDVGSIPWPAQWVKDPVLLQAAM